ncbi:helix-turn-helix domain-containing protein [Bacillus licheniformis]|uniref:helix-turn-helix domain-containing protein n=1 Tax=Bacillus licheniformis TaxID=1402 RepID=UPI003BF72C2C
MFVGEKLTDIRVLHGYSRNELATILGVSEQSVWQYENGYATPGIQTMNKLREIFKVRTKFFYTEQKIENDIKEEAIAYRSSERNSIKKTKTETIHLKYLNYLVDYIEQYVEYPINNILKLREFTIKEINNNNGLNEGSHQRNFITSKTNDRA